MTPIEKKIDLLLKGFKLNMESDYIIGSQTWLKEYDEIFKESKEEDCCEMPEENDALVSDAEGVKN